MGFMAHRGTCCPPYFVKIRTKFQELLDFPLVLWHKMGVISELTRYVLLHAQTRGDIGTRSVACCANLAVRRAQSSGTAIVAGCDLPLPSGPRKTP